jgi:hypothetical protein
LLPLVEEYIRFFNNADSETVNRVFLKGESSINNCGFELFDIVLRGKRQ